MTGSHVGSLSPMPGVFQAQKKKKIMPKLETQSGSKLPEYLERFSMIHLDSAKSRDLCTTFKRSRRKLSFYNGLKFLTFPLNGISQINLICFETMSIKHPKQGLVHSRYSNVSFLLLGAITWLTAPAMPHSKQAEI